MTRIGAGDANAVPLVRGLWLEMVDHHRVIAQDRVGVLDHERSWVATRDKYLSWFAADMAILLLAHDDDELIGFLLCRLDATPTRTFDMGALYADIDSLVVSERARGAGVGSALLKACRADLIARGVEYCTIGVVAGNDGAQALYERFGFRPHYLDMIASLKPEG